MFNINEQNIYVRTDSTFIYAITLAISFILMIIAVYVFSNRIQNANVLTLCGVCILLLAGFIIRFISSNTNFDWLCLSISFVFIDIYYVDLSLRLDPLTKLLNRQVYQTVIEKLNYTTMVFVIDANNFKHVNDKYGHECGDRTLRSIAKCIFKAYGSNALCFRIGGDEFCVILKPNMFKKLIEQAPRADAYLMAEQQMAKLDEIIRERAGRDEKSCLEYGVSTGYAVYYDPSEYPNIKNNMPLDKVIRLADRRMYHKKEEYKKNAAKEEPTADEENVKREKVVYEPKDPELIEDSGK